MQKYNAKMYHRPHASYNAYVQNTPSHKRDTFPEDYSLAMVYIPWQEFEENDLFCDDTALKNGTLFKDLYKPWKGGCR